MLRFILKNIKDITPWGSNDQLTLSWFALTDSYYWFDFAGVQFPYYNEKMMNNRSEEKTDFFVDYYFARIFSDICDIFRYVAIPVPDEIFTYVNSIEKFEDYQQSLQQWKRNRWDESDEQFDLIIKPAQEWLYSRRLDFGYLVGGPDLYLIRNGSRIHFYWRADFTDESGKGLWNNNSGEYSCDYDEFITELLKSFISFGCEMQEQILQLIEHKPPGVKINIDQIKQNQIQYEDRVGLIERESFTPADLTDWVNISEKIKIILEDGIK